MQLDTYAVLDKEDTLYPFVKKVADATELSPELSLLAGLSHVVPHRAKKRPFSAFFQHRKARFLIRFRDSELKKMLEDPRLASTSPALQEGLDYVESKEFIYNSMRHAVIGGAFAVWAVFAALSHMNIQDDTLEVRFKDLAKVGATNFYADPSKQLVSEGLLPTSPGDVMVVYNLKAQRQEEIRRHPLMSPQRLWDGSYDVQHKPLSEGNKAKAQQLLGQTN